MNGLPYYPRYPRDFFDGTIGLSFEVKGAYAMLLDLIYMSGGKLYDDSRFIAGHMNCSVRAWNSYRAVLLERGKITIENGIISNFRADKELIIQRSFQDKQRQNALQPKKNKGLAQAVAQPKVSHTDTDTESYGAGGDTRASRTDREAILAAIGVDPVSGITGPSGRMLGTQADMAEVARWLELPGLTIPLILAEVRSVMSKKRDGPPSSFRFFSQAMQRLSGELTRPALDPITPTNGGQHDRQRFDRAIDALAAGLSAGTVGLGLEDRDPFNRSGASD